MQYVLDCAAEAVLFAGFAFTALSFLSYAWNRASAAAPAPSPAAARPQRPAPSTPPLPTSEGDAELEEAWQILQDWEITPTPTTEPDPWETESELPAYLLPPLPLMPPAPYLLLLPPAAPEVVAEPPRLPDTIRELRKLCKERGLKGAGRWTKAQCLNALAA